MGYRLSKIYTRTGDKGTTGLGNGSRVEKDHLRVEAYGTVDELNSCLGVVLAANLPEPVRQSLQTIQHELFDLGGELAMPGYEIISAEFTERLEQTLDSFNADLPPLGNFILPAGGPATSACHLARAVCRRAERRLYSLSREEAINPHTLTYLNRLSDLLFVIARVLVRFENGEEVIWQPCGKR